MYIYYNGSVNISTMCRFFFGGGIWFIGCWGWWKDTHTCIHTCKHII